VPSAPLFDPATRTWSITAIGPKLGGRRGGPPASITGTGTTEVEALRDLLGRLR
jgi:hypothetical protein